MKIALEMSSLYIQSCDHLGIAILSKGTRAEKAERKSTPYSKHRRGNMNKNNIQL
jgi:hypothetical protein